MAKLQKETKCDIETVDFSTLPPKHEKAVSLMVAGKTITEAAEESGLSRQTLSRLVHNNPIVREELSRQRGIVASGIADKMRNMLNKALEAIEESFENPAIAPEEKLKAAIAIVGRMTQGANISPEHISARDIAQTEANAQTGQQLALDILSGAADKEETDRVLMKYYLEINAAESESRKEK